MLDRTKCELIGDKMKTKYVPVRMDKKMQTALDIMQEELGVSSRSEVVRQAVHDYLSSNRPHIRKQLVEEFINMRRAFANAGNNLNQVAARLNMKHPVSTPEVKKAQENLLQTFGEMVRFYRRIEDNLRG